MNKIIALTDYKKKFGSKHFDTPYRSGMDKEKLSNYFNDLGYKIEFKYLSEVHLDDPELKNANILYTSSEDIGYRYKSYIEDIVFGLELAGAHMIPAYKHLRANNNKAFMELMREAKEITPYLKSRVFGSMADLQMRVDTLTFPCVFKESEGASGRGVALVKSKEELYKKVKTFSKPRNYFEDLKDYGRALKHDGYIKESIYRDKFIVQDFIPDLKNDWKVYVFGEKLYTFKRPILKGRGIKASGGGYDNYLYGLEAEAPIGMFDLAMDVFNTLDVPHVSIDFAYDGKQFYVLEFQSLYFGTAGIPYSKGYFTKRNDNWEFIEEKLEIEKVYADSIVAYVNR